MENRTTSKHFKIFKKEAELWIDRLGLSEWRVDFSHSNCPDGSPCRAWYHGKVEDRVCEIGLVPDWDPDVVTIHRVKECAFHEVFHVALADLEAIAECRSFVQNRLDTGLHQVIRRFENLFYGNAKPKIKKV